MQLFIPRNSNPKRREKVVTNFSVSQKRLRLCLRVPNSDVMFAVYKVIWYSVLHYYERICNPVQ